MPEAEQWREQANCRGHDTELFFAEAKDSHVSARMARRICERCIVIEDCLQYALDHNIRYGIWGGSTAMERRQYREQGLTAEQALESHLSKPLSAVY